MGDYWLRHIHLDLTYLFALALDNGVNTLVESTIGISLGNRTPFAKERMRLPVRQKGMGLRQAADRKFAKFVGGMPQGLMHILDCVDSEGNTVQGRYNTPAITTLLGEGAFNGENFAPWDVLIAGWLWGLGFLGTI